MRIASEKFAAILAFFLLFRFNVLATLLFLSNSFCFGPRYWFFSGRFGVVCIATSASGRPSSAPTPRAWFVVLSLFSLPERDRSNPWAVLRDGRMSMPKRKTTTGLELTEARSSFWSRKVRLTALFTYLYAVCCGK